MGPDRDRELRGLLDLLTRIHSRLLPLRRRPLRRADFAEIREAVSAATESRTAGLRPRAVLGGDRDVPRTGLQ